MTLSAGLISGGSNVGVGRGSARAAHRDPRGGELVLDRRCRLPAGVVVVEGEDHALHLLALQEVEVVARKTVRAVDRDRRRDAGLMERESIEDALGEDHFL